MDKEYQIERLKDLEEDMNDDYKSWQEAEKEILSSIEWRNKMSLNYAKSAIKFYDYKKEIKQNG